MRTLIAIATISCVVATASAQVEADFTRILLPVTVRNLPGANGAEWTTDLTISIEPAAGVKLILPLLGPSACDPPCPDLTVVPPDDRSFPIDFFRTHSGETAGSFMYVDPTITKQVHLSLVVRDAARSATATELPVVTADQFVSENVVLMRVPVNSDSRSTLRVYGYDPGLPGSVRLRIFAEDGTNTVLVDQPLSLSVVQRLFLTPSGSLRLRPPVSEVNLDSLLTKGQTVRIQLTPATPGLRIWAFAAIADNLTNEVSVRTPR